MQHALTNNAMSKKIQNSRSRFKVKITEHVQEGPSVGHFSVISVSWDIPFGRITWAVSSAPKLATSWSSWARVSSPPGGASRARAASSRLPDSTSLQHSHINICTWLALCRFLSLFFPPIPMDSFAEFPAPALPGGEQTANTGLSVLEWEFSVGFPWSFLSWLIPKGWERQNMAQPHHNHTYYDPSHAKWQCYGAESRGTEIKLPPGAGAEITNCGSGSFLFIKYLNKFSVLRIHDILGWIRIRGSMPLTNGSGSCYFRHWPSRCQQKN
jgi:hypothetical protein